MIPKSSSFKWLVIVSLLITRILADTSTCGNGKKCPEDSPCCSQYGECGTGLYCLGACDPLNSYNLSACVPMPVCKTQKFTFDNDDSVQHQSKYLGDSDKYGWTTNGDVLEYQNSLLLTMANQSYGTVLSSTQYIWYGKVSAKLRTSHGAGVVSAFILMSGSKDEIDYEFVGNAVTEAQTNFYWQGVLNYTNSDKVTLSATNETTHTYTVDWQQDKIEWSIDGQVARTLNKADTYNSTTKKYQFPQTPAIIQLSLWPGGSSKNAEGTVEWAGGPIDWDMPEFKDPGYLYATLEEVDIECYDTPSSAGSGDVYLWNDDDMLESSVKLGNSTHVLGSFEACGFDMEKGSSDSIATASQAAPTDVGSGTHQGGSSNSSIADASQESQTTSSSSSTRGNNKASSSSSSSSSRSGSAGSGSSAATATAAAATDSSSDATGFIQDTSASASGKSSDASMLATRIASTSMLAGLVVSLVFLVAL